MTALPCSAPASVRLEGYSPRDGFAHGNLDVIVHACPEHAAQARTEWLDGLTPYSTTPTTGARCGDRISFTGTPHQGDADLMHPAAQQVTALSVGHLMDAPLPQLVDELDVKLVESRITARGFTGYAYVDRYGVTVALPPGRSEVEHDCVARYLIGAALRVEGLPPLPEMFQIVDVTTDVQRAQGAAHRDDNGRGSR